MFLALIIGFFGNGLVANAQTPTRILDPIPYLDEELNYMKQIEQYLFSVEKTRMKMFEVYTNQVITKLNDPERGLGHEETSEAFKDQISAIDSAESYFTSIRNNYTASAIDKILFIQSKLMGSFGYNRKAYAKNLFRMLTQIEFQLRELSNKSISEQLRKKIDELYRPLGIATVKASAGDTRKAYEAAMPVANSLSQMYEDFHHLSGSNEIFEAALMIEFLNERLVSYGQYDFNS